MHRWVFRIKPEDTGPNQNVTACGTRWYAFSSFHGLQLLIVKRPSSRHRLRLIIALAQESNPRCSQTFAIRKSMVLDILPILLTAPSANCGFMRYLKGYRLIQQVGGGGFSTCVRSEGEMGVQSSMMFYLPGYFKLSIPRTIASPPARWSH